MPQPKPSGKTLAQAMAEFAFALSYEAIPAEVITTVRRHLADTLACAFGARGSATARALREHVLTRSGRAEATVIGTSSQVPAGSAALVNGTMIRELDANDIYVLRSGSPSGHFSDATAALLALAERQRCSGKELITCLVASYELQGAVAESLNFWQRGLHPLSNAAWTTPIIAARLLGATAAQAVHACGLAAAAGTVLNTWIHPAQSIPAIKSVAVGLAAQRAVEAAELAARGVTATDDALETVLKISDGLSNLRLGSAALKQLGKRWTTTRNMLKRYPAQINTQAAIEAAVELHRRGVRAEAVRKLTLYGHRNVCAGVQGAAEAFAPRSREAADHSTPFVMAMALLRGRLTAREYDGAPWRSTEVKKTMAKIELVVDPEIDRAFAANGNLGVRLVAELKHGRTEEVFVRQPKGHPDAPLSDDELLEKMTWLLSGVNDVEPRRLLDRCRRLSTAEQTAELLRGVPVEHAGRIRREHRR